MIMKVPSRLLVPVGLVGALAVWWSLEATAPGTRLWQGYAEADLIHMAPAQSGQLADVLVTRGAEVHAGDILFTQDAAGDRALRDQARQQLIAAQAALANLTAPARQAEIAGAEAALAEASANRENAATELIRVKNLFETGFATDQTLEARKAALLAASARLDAATAALAQAKSPRGREDEIRGAEASVAGAEAALKAAQWRLDQRIVRARMNGRIADVMARPGEMINAGTAVVSLLPQAGVFVRFFVPERDLPGLHPGDAVALACDGCGKGLRGTVSFLAPQAEYTPPVIYSETSRAKLVFLLEARPEAEAALRLNPGQPVSVSPLHAVDTP